MTIPFYSLSREEFERKRAAGEFNPLAGVEDYEAMLGDGEEIWREADGLIFRSVRRIV